MNFIKHISVLLVVLLVAVSAVGCTEQNTVQSSSNDVVSDTVTSNDTVSEESSTMDKASSEKPSSVASPSSSRPESSSKPMVSSEPEIKYTAKEKVLFGLDPDVYKLSLTNAGNTARIAALMKKAQKGGNYKIAVLGGSISQGAGASSVFSSYGNMVCEWWNANFTNSTFEFVNAGIGSTNPEMACYRIETDLLAYKPDFVVVDFTVNTYLDNEIKATYSTLLYKILSQSNAPAVMSIDFTSCDRQNHDLAGKYIKTKSVPNANITAAVKAYDIPAVSYHNYIWNKIDKKVISWRDIGDDYIHPNDNGHMIAANIITTYLEKVMSNLSKESTKITASKAPEDTQFLNLGYVTNTAEGVKLSGGFTASNNSSASTRGWKYSFTSDASELVVPMPANKTVKLFMKFDSGSSGIIEVMGANGGRQTVSSSEAATPTLVEVYAMGSSITIKPLMESGGFTIFGIAYNK